MEVNGDQPPLVWPQFESTRYSRRRSSIPDMIGPVVIGVISAVIFLVFVNFLVPPFISITSQILQPASVKRGWDSINVVLVVFAILCGVLARRNDDGLASSQSSSHGLVEEEGVAMSDEMTVGEDSKINSSSEEWFDDAYDADRLKIYESFSSRSFAPSVLPVTGTQSLRRSSTSYPDLRNEVLRETTDRRFQFYDDFGIDKYRSQDSRSYEQFSNRSRIEIEVSEPKEVLVDKFVVRPSSPPQQPPAPVPPPPPPPPRRSPVEVSQKPRRTHRSVRNIDAQENAKRNVTSSDSARFNRALQPPPSPPPPPPPPPPFITATPPRKQGSLQRRKSNAAKEIKMVFASLYNQGKRKKKLQKSKRKDRTESPEAVVTEPPPYRSLIPPPSPPPPPPPPPPPRRSSQSVFYGLFKKGVKSKKIHSIPVPPPPPPPRKIHQVPQTPPRRAKSGRPPRPTKPTNFNEDSYVNNGQASPLIQMTPPPPPPPPFRVAPLKFVVSGDFAKIRSNQSSRCSSPEREVIDLGWGLELTQSDGGVETTVAIGGTGFCPSPDVNTKADNFIARLRDEWRLDKMNSVKGKRKVSTV